MQQSVDVIVVGAGVIGLMTARELAHAGLSVTLIERGRPGREASHAAGGILSSLAPWDAEPVVAPLAAWSQARYPDLVEELLDETGIDAEWTRSGAIVFGEVDIGRARAWAARTGSRIELLSGTDIQTCEPAAHPDWPQAVFLPDTAQLRNPLLMRALTASLSGRGVELHQHTEVHALEVSGGRVCGVRTAKKRLTAARVVLAAGAWTDVLLEGIGALGVRPVLGQMIAYRTEPGSIRRILVHGDRYVIPRRDGVCVVGSTVEDAGFARRMTPEAVAGLELLAARLAPQLAGQPIRDRWSGLRPGRTQEAPSIGAHPALDGLYVSTGHHRAGITLAPASARLLTDLITGRSTPLPDAEYRPEPIASPAQKPYNPASD